MPKITIEFKKEEFDELDTRLKYGTHGHIGVSALFDIDQSLRTFIKYDKKYYDGEIVQDVYDLAEKIRADIHMSGALEFYE